MIFDRIDKGISNIHLEKDVEIELNKAMSRTMSDVRNEIKTGKCFYCGKPVDSYCSSHNIPRFCLENIGENGEVSGINSILGLPKMGVPIGKKNLGIGEAGTFYLICRECDSVIFQDYENPENYELDKIPTQKMLAQVAMKNYLKFIYKRKMEIALWQHAIKNVSKYELEASTPSIELKKREEVSQIDLPSYIRGFERAKKNAEKGKGRGYFLFYYKLLNYVTPIAIQAPIAVSIDLEGNVINDIYNMDLKYELSDMHLCVFPQKETTAIMLFFEEGEKKYSKFRKQFKKLDEESKLAVINYIIFLYSEDYYLSKELGSKVDIGLFNDVANQTLSIRDTTPIKYTSVLSERFNLSNWDCIPNILAEKDKL